MRIGIKHNGRVFWASFISRYRDETDIKLDRDNKSARVRLYDDGSARAICADEIGTSEPDAIAVAREYMRLRGLSDWREVREWHVNQLRRNRRDHRDWARGDIAAIRAADKAIAALTA
ncbi:MAG TPA: hypothetical protein P5318_19950 [Candidatus Hydrogenedentes bacterium]|nr:hypothetical protein [Candidatus Hydrogenedentota bacterium]